MNIYYLTNLHKSAVTLVFLFISIFTQQAFAQDSTSHEKPFVIVIPSHNNIDWYKKNLDSIFTQKYHNYRVIYISDGSTDGSDRLVDTYVRQCQQEHRFTHIKNTQRNGPLSCMCRAIFSCNKEEIVVDLDGNDWLASHEVLAILNRFYQNPDVWMTYGQFVYFPGFRKGFTAEVSKEIIRKNSFRTDAGAFTHLKTFYAGLFHEIDKGDLLYEGQFIPEAYDLAYSLPLIEMAGIHSKFISQPLYVYNESRPLNRHKNVSYLETEFDIYIRSKKKYEPLTKLPFLENGKAIPDPIYGLIEDLSHPTLNDYRLVQEFLSHGERKNLERLRDMEARMRAMKLIGATPDEFPRSGSIPKSCAIDARENCILIFSTFNLNYPKGLMRLFKLIMESDYHGHVLYQLGGWPNTEEGSLVLSHVPYAFKASFFKEAQKKGFKRVLWLDTAVVPLVSLNTIFAMIEEKGYFVMGNERMVGPYMAPEAAAYFGLTHQQTFDIPSCSAGLFGVDFTNETGRSIIDRWYQAAHDKDAFFSARSDQNALSIILHQLNLTDFMNLDRMPHSRNEIKADSVFWLDRESVLY